MAGVYIRTEEHRMKMSEMSKGNTNMLGKHLSEETKQKISNAHLGQRDSEETRAKKSLARKGELNPNWKGGISTETHSIRTCSKTKEWRTAVFERDNYTCQDCGDDTGGNLNAHHIKSFKEYPELRFDVNNGITYCVDCHRLTDNYLSKSITVVV